MTVDLARVSVRPFKPSDADDFLRWASDDLMTKFLRWGPVCTRQEALSLIIEECIPQPYRRSICFDDRSIGFVWLYLGSHEFDWHKGNLSYGVGFEWWGQGIATRALKMAIPQIFKELPNLMRIEGFVKVGNEASGRVLEKVGFQREGLLRKFFFYKNEPADMHCYSFLSSDLVKPT